MDRRLFGKDYGKRIQAYLARIATVKDAERRPDIAPVPAAVQRESFEQVVAAGIDDPQADPEGTRVAYERSAHEVRLIAMR